MMNYIGVVPVDTKIFRCWFQIGKTSDGVIAVVDALWIGVFGNTPDPFHSLVVVYKIFHQIHIGTVLCHRNIDHLDAKAFGDGKVPVVAGYWTQEFNFI